MEQESLFTAKNEAYKGQTRVNEGQERISKKLSKTLRRKVVVQAMSSTSVLTDVLMAKMDVGGLIVYQERLLKSSRH